jgi:hypothetical protein
MGDIGLVPNRLVTAPGAPATGQKDRRCGQRRRMLATDPVARVLRSPARHPRSYRKEDWSASAGGPEVHHSRVPGMPGPTAADGGR